MFLTADFGAANSKLAQFDLTEDGGLLLTQYGFQSLGQEGLQEGTREPALQKALQQSLHSFRSKTVNVCAPGFHTFSKFVKLPPVDTSKVTQIIQYEAQQNVPFPLDEVVWDYQILGATATGELEVFLVAIKSDIVEGLFKVAEAAGLRLQLVDVPPAALCNAFRYNYPDYEGCSMLLDIGAKTSNLLFFEKGSAAQAVFSRSINIGANAITLDFMKEARLTYADAERIKIEEGFVSLGGAYEEPDNPHQAAISKIARQVMTRLHIQVNQTIQSYRNNQGGSAPQRLLLAGGGSIMPYTAQFFSEKLNMAPESVEYFNPFRNVAIAPDLNREELAKVAHAMGEVVGLGLRNLAHCPIELNLMPKSALKGQELNKKKPYFVAAALCLLLVLFAIGWFYNKVAEKKASALETVQQRLEPLQRQQSALNRVMADLNNAESQADQYVYWMEDRFFWASLLTDLRNALMTVENRQKDTLKADTGVWVEKLSPVLCNVNQSANPPVGPWIQDTGGGSTSSGDGSAPPPPPRRGRGKPGRDDSGSGQAHGEICKVILHCRAIHASAAPDANTRIAFDLEKELNTMTNHFGTNVVPGAAAADAAGLTYSCEFTATLKRALRF
jgi:type IV pilus assembly protein PilM